MMLRCVVVFLALTLSGVSAEVLSCSDLKPVRHLDVMSLHGDWIIVRTHLTVNGTCLEPDPAVRLQLKCLYLHYEVSGTRVSGFTRHESYKSDFIMEAERKEHGRWRVMSRTRTGNEKHVLVLSADPEKHLMTATCEVNDPSIVFSTFVRYDPRTGTPALDEQEVTSLVARVNDEQALPVCQPVNFRNQCFEEP